MNHTSYNDAEAREKLIQKDFLDKNIFLAAGAGSGKTSSLVKRVVALVLDGRDISTVVAITFTREAAKMFYGRITKALEEGAKTAPEEKGRKMLKEALANIDSAFFGTIDSFCRKLLLEHPSEAKISSDITPLEKSSQRRELASEVFEKLINSQRPINAFKTYKELRDYDLNNRQIVNIIDYVAEEDIFEIEMGEKPASFAENIVQKQWLDDAFMIADSLRKEYEERFVAGNNRKTAEELTTKGCYASYLKGIKALDLRNPMKALKYLELMVGAWNYKRSKLPKPLMSLERAEAILSSSVTEDLKKQFEANKYYKALEFGNMMRPLLLTLAKERGLITYNRSLKALVDMLALDEKNGGELLSYIRAKYKYYLIDEFQDTNPLQTRLFKYLTNDMPGALFIVGDDKQAIYRFRGGDVDNFKTVENGFAMDEKSVTLSLTCNFRSSEALREWFDRKFGEMQFFGLDFPEIEQADKQKQFCSIKNDVIDGVYEYPVIRKKNGSGGKDGIAGNEHGQVISIIHHLLGKKVSCYDHEKNIMAAHSLAYEDIMVITNTKAKLGGYIDAFRAAGIPYNVAGSSNLKNSRGLQMVARVLDVIIYPEDKYKEAICLMAEPFSLTEKELYDQIYDTPGESLVKSKNLIESLRLETEQRAPAAIYLHIMEKLKLTQMLSAFNMGEEPDTLYYGLELVRQATAEGTVVDAKSLLSFIGEELLSGDHEYEMALSGTPEGVRLMNLHKTKGLESKVVILADAEKPSDKSSRVNKRYDYSKMSVNFFSIPDSSRNNGSGGNIAETHQFDNLRAIEITKLQEEQVRLKYVAATRAENILIIPRLFKNETKPEELYHGLVPGEQIDGGWDMLLTDQLKILEPEVRSQEVKISELYVEPLEFEHPRINAEASYITINPSRAATGNETLSMAETQEIAELQSMQGLDVPLVTEDDENHEELIKWQKDGSLIGTMVHQMMETLVKRVHETINPDELSVIANNILLLNKAPAEDVPFFKSLIIDITDKMYCGGFPQNHVTGFENVPVDIMMELRQSQEIYTELPFSVYLKKDDDAMDELSRKLNLEAGKDVYINGVMDLVYKKGGCWHICDYKTNFSAENLLEHYNGQLLLYKAILKMIFKLDYEPRAFVYHIPARSKEDHETVSLRQQFEG